MKCIHGTLETLGCRETLGMGQWWSELLRNPRDCMASQKLRRQSQKEKVKNSWCLIADCYFFLLKGEGDLLFGRVTMILSRWGLALSIVPLLHVTWADACAPTLPKAQRGLIRMFQNKTFVLIPECFLHIRMSSQTLDTMFWILHLHLKKTAWITAWSTYTGSGKSDSFPTVACSLSKKLHTHVSFLEVA